MCKNIKYEHRSVSAITCDAVKQGLVYTAFLPINRQLFRAAVNFHDGQPILLYAEVNVESGEAHAVDSVRLSLIGGARIFSKAVDGGWALIFRQHAEEIVGEDYLQFMIAYLICIAADGIWMTVREGKIWFDIEDRGAIEQIAARDNEYNAVSVALLNALQFDRGETDGIRAKGRSTGKYANSFIAAQSRGTYRGRPFIAVSQ